MSQRQVLGYERLVGFEARDQGLKSKFEHDPGFSAGRRMFLNIRADE